jgi:hypothetical protein
MQITAIVLNALAMAPAIALHSNFPPRHSSAFLLTAIAPVRMRKVAGMYEEVERETRRLLGTLPERDLDAVIRFFEMLRAAGMGEGA